MSERRKPSPEAMDADDIRRLAKAVRGYPCFNRFWLRAWKPTREEARWTNEPGYHVWTDGDRPYPPYPHEDIIAYAEVRSRVCGGCGRDRP